MIYFGRNRAIEICEQKAEPWSWAEQQTVTDPPPRTPTQHQVTEQRSAWLPPALLGGPVSDGLD